MSRAEFDRWLIYAATKEQQDAYLSWKPEIQASFRVSWYIHGADAFSVKETCDGKKN